MADKWSKLELQVNSGVIKHKRHLTGVKTQFFSGQMMEEDKKKKRKEAGFRTRDVIMFTKFSVQGSSKQMHSNNQFK